MPSSSSRRNGGKKQPNDENKKNGKGKHEINEQNKLVSSTCSSASLHEVTENHDSRENKSDRSSVVIPGNSVVLGRQRESSSVPPPSENAAMPVNAPAFISRLAENQPQRNSVGALPMNEIGFDPKLEQNGESAQDDRNNSAQLAGNNADEDGSTKRWTSAEYAEAARQFYRVTARSEEDGDYDANNCNSRQQHCEDPPAFNLSRCMRKTMNDDGGIGEDGGHEQEENEHAGFIEADDSHHSSTHSTPPPPPDQPEVDASVNVGADVQCAPPAGSMPAHNARFLNQIEGIGAPGGPLVAMGAAVKSRGNEDVSKFSFGVGARGQAPAACSANLGENAPGSGNNVAIVSGGVLLSANGGGFQQNVMGERGYQSECYAGRLSSSAGPGHLHNASAVARSRAAQAQAQGMMDVGANANNGGNGNNANAPLGWQSTKPTLKERFAFMYCNEILADVHFVVGRGEHTQRIPAHKFVLSVGSAVFDAMFNGPLSGSRNSSNNVQANASNYGQNNGGQNLGHNPNNQNNDGNHDIELPDVEPAAFTALLKFLYSDEVVIGPESVMTTLYTAKKYAVPALENACVDFLKKNLSADNAFMLLTQARLFDEPQLAYLCLETIDKHTAEALAADGFTDVDLETLCAVLERDTLRIREAVLFQAVVRWSICECQRQQLPVTPANQREVLGRALGLIRFPLMTVEEFAQNVALRERQAILNDRELVDLFLYFTVNPKPPTAFLDVARSCVAGKEQVVNRFQRIEGRWGYSGTADRIKFTVDRRIFVVGFGLYGSIHGPTEYQVQIQIIHCGTGKVVGANDTTFHCDGSSSTFRVAFKDPVEISPSVTYIAIACLKGPDSHYGTKGLRRIVHQSPSSGCVTFQFTYAAGNNNGTSVEDGQIPEIIFYTKLR